MLSKSDLFRTSLARVASSIKNKYQIYNALIIKPLNFKFKMNDVVLKVCNKCKKLRALANLTVEKLLSIASLRSTTKLYTDYSDFK